MPVPAYNTFNEIFDSLDADRFNPGVPLNTELINPEDFTNENWPVQPGDYHVLNAKQSIALTVLQGVDMDAATETAAISHRVAIIGKISTENLGVEHLLKNVIANPFIRHLVLWGKDIEGHLPGNALINLIGNGVDRSKRIIGAQGARPVLKNATESEIHHLRRQIQVTDLMGVLSIPTLAARLEKLDRQGDSPYEAGLKIDVIKIQEAKPARRLTLDPSGYFVILVMKGHKNPLQVEHYSNDGRLKNIIAGNDPASVCATLIGKNLVSRLDHAAYLGRELAKAETSLGLGSQYTQDKAQGALQPKDL